MSEEQKVSRSRDHAPTTCAAERTATESSAAGRALLEEIAAERERQKAVEGWTPEHDDEHGDANLAMAAASYAIPADRRELRATPHHYEHNGRAQADDLEWYPAGGNIMVPKQWPWEGQWWKPDIRNRRRDLIRAAALIVAEIERLDRAKAEGRQ